MKKLLTLEDLAGKTHEELVNHILTEYQPEVGQLEGIQILVAYESVGAWGCDSSSFWLFRKGKKLFEVRRSHCSCYGFEGQWEPSEVALSDLKNDSFYIGTGGYDGNAPANEQAVKDYIQAL